MHLSLSKTQQAVPSGTPSENSPPQLLLTDLPPSSVPYGPLLKHFEEIQNHHNAFKLKIFQQQNKVLMPTPSRRAAEGETTAPGGGSMRSFSPETNDQMIKSFSTSDSLER